MSDFLKEEARQLIGKGRRSRVDLYCPAEIAIRDAIGIVESMGAHEYLTWAVIFLGRAKDKVADFVEGVPTLTDEQKLANLTAALTSDRVAEAGPALIDALEQALEYFEEREDISAQNERVGNIEMKLAHEIRAALAKTLPPFHLQPRGQVDGND